MKKVALLLLILTIPAIIPLLSPLFYEPHDLHHLADIYQMARAILTGQIPPRLGPDFSFGYGYPLFNFYYILPFYLGAGFYFVLGSLTAAYKLVFIVSVLVSVYGMYLFLREYVGRLAAFGGTVLFLYTPYRAVEIYVRGAMGEALAFALLPWVLWVISKIIKTREPRYKYLGALIISLFVLAHNYFWFMSIVWVVSYALLLLYKKPDYVKKIKDLVTSGLLGLCLTAYWWIPALLEKKYIERLTPFLLEDHFPFLKQLIIPSWGYGASVWGPGDGLSFQIGVVNLAVIIVGILVLAFRSHQLTKNKLTKLLVWSLIGFFVSVFMMNIRSLFLWKLIPFYDFIQFPWRLLIFTTFFSSIVAAVIIERYARMRGVFMAIAAFSIVFTFSYFRPSGFVDKTDEQYLTLFFSNPGYSEDYLLLPNWVDQRPLFSPKQKIVSSTATVANIRNDALVDWQAEVYAQSTSVITFNEYYFPGWNATVDGEATTIDSGKPNGQIEITIPAGYHKIRFFWSENNRRKIADYISLAAVTILLFGYAKNVRVADKK